MANDIRMTCWDTPDRLALGIYVANPIGQAAEDAEELVQVDTGYSGELLLPYDNFVRLNLNHWRLPRTVNATTVTGEKIQMLEAHALVTIPKLREQQRVIVQTFQGNVRFLVGRAFLRRFRVLLDGPKAQTCILPQ